jgi:hypothetical protein
MMSFGERPRKRDSGAGLARLAHFRQSPHLESAKEDVPAGR